MQLGLSSDEFWKLTPAQYDAMLAQHDAMERAHYVRAGAIAAAAYNAAPRKQGARPIKPSDIFPHLREGR